MKRDSYFTPVEGILNGTTPANLIADVHKTDGPSLPICSISIAMSPSGIITTMGFNPAVVSALHVKCGGGIAAWIDDLAQHLSANPEFARLLERLTSIIADGLDEKQGGE